MAGAGCVLRRGCGGSLARQDLGEARPVDAGLLLALVGGRQDQGHRGPAVWLADQRVVGLVPPEQGPALSDGGVVLGVLAQRARADHHHGERHVEEEGELHRDVEVVLDEEGDALARVGAARGREPDRVVVALHLRIVRDPNV